MIQPHKLLIWAATAILGACAKQPADVSVAAAAAVSGALPVASTAMAPVVSSAASTPSVRAYLDPVTGELRAPTPAEQAAAAQRLKADAGTAALKQSAPVEEIRLPNGMIEVLLGDRVMHQERVCIQANGEVTSDCKHEAGQKQP